jgi:hypothetical protein
VNRNLFRLAASLSLAAAAAASVFPSGPAAAAASGTVQLSQTSGTVDATPIFASATASGPCPAGYGTNALVRVGPPGGPFTNLAKPLSAGNYDKAPVSAAPNRSFTMALGGTPPSDGEWWVVVECFSRTEGMHPERFVTPITVSGRQWRAGKPAGSTGPATAPTGQASSAAPTAGSTAATDPSPTTSADPHLAGSVRVGSASLANIWWLLAVAGVLAVVGVIHLVTRSPDSQSTRSANDGRGKGST